MRKVLILFVSTFLLAVFWSSSLLNIGSEPLPRQYDAERRQTEGLRYLRSFENVELAFSQDDSTFNATQRVNSLAGVELLNATKQNASDYFVSFETTYVHEIGIVFLKANLYNGSSEVDQISVLGFPFYNETLQQPDVSFEYFGEKLFASDLLNKAVNHQSDSPSMLFVLEDGGGGSSNPPVVNVTMPILQISISIINSGVNLIQEEINKLQQIIPVDFWLDGPLHYMLWYVKSLKAFDNYNHNKNQSIPTTALKDGYINDQSQLSSWKFGFQSFNQNGCGVISLYNLLVSQNRTPNLSLLILLSELMNADLGLGFLGLVPMSNDLLMAVSNTVNVVFQAMQPLLHASSPIIAGIITERLISDQLGQSTYWWEDMLIWASMPGQYAITLAAVNMAIVAAVASVDLVTDFYLEHLHGIPDILNVLGYNSLDVSYLSYDIFSSGRIAYGYFIITFFNSVPNFSNPQTLGGHTIFVKRVKVNETTLITYNNGISTSNNFYNLYAISYSSRNSQFLTGVTIKG
jgi:hypothetical protein